MCCNVNHNLLVLKSQGGDDVNAKELAKLLDLHPNTIYTMIREGKIEAEKVGKSFEIPQHEVTELMTSKFGSDLNAENERAAYTLINEYNSKIDMQLHGIMVTVFGMAENLSKVNDLPVTEVLPALRSLYHERNEFKYLIELVFELKRYEKTVEQLEILAKESEEANSFEKLHQFHVNRKEFHRKLLGGDSD